MQPQRMRENLTAVTNQRGNAWASDRIRFTLNTVALGLVDVTAVGGSEGE